MFRGEAGKCALPANPLLWIRKPTRKATRAADEDDRPPSVARSGSFGLSLPDLEADTAVSGPATGLALARALNAADGRSRLSAHRRAKRKASTLEPPEG